MIGLSNCHAPTSMYSMLCSVSSGIAIVSTASSGRFIDQ